MSKGTHRMGLTYNYKDVTLRRQPLVASYFSLSQKPNKWVTPFCRVPGCHTTTQPPRCFPFLLKTMFTVNLCLILFWADKKKQLVQQTHSVALS